VNKSKKTEENLGLFLRGDVGIAPYRDKEYNPKNVGEGLAPPENFAY